MNLEEQILDEEYNEDENEIENENEEEETKVKNSAADYGKIASAIGKMRARNVNFSLPDINKSDITFTPDLDTNTIIYGLRGITRVGNQLIKDIIKNRPYTSIDDFLFKIKVNKTQMISLIKAGVFDELYGNDRILIMNKYLDLISDKKKRITLQNMAMLINYNLIPEEYSFEIRVFNFNKYLKKFKSEDNYHLDTIAMKFFSEYYNTDILNNVVIDGEEQNGDISQNIWDNTYKKEMEPVKVWMKKNQESILNNLNEVLFNESAKKYAEGSISKWEMASLNFYYHEHELQRLRSDIYDIDDYFSLPDNPEIEREFNTKDGSLISIYKLHRIAGTIIDKNKNKSMITLLTTTGVVNVKIWKNQFTVWDKQISQIGVDGKKHVIEKSWFTRGNKVIITGIKRDNTFVPKKYKNTEYSLFEKIIELDDKGFILKSQTERKEEK